MSNKGMLLIISGPSGSGKGTVVKSLRSTDIDYALSISMTTRKPREGEQNGRDYFFCTEEEFIAKRENDELLEHAIFCGNMYGTPKDYVIEQIVENKVVILEIDVNGALQIKEKFGEAILIFLIPPTLESLKSRLIGRNTEDLECINDRLKRALEEIKLIDKYDYLVINDELSDAISQINSIVGSESLRPKRNIDFINKLKGADIVC